MHEKGKNPPVNLNEIEKQVEEDGGPGPLSYVDSSPLGAKGMKTNWVQILIPVLLAVVLSVLATILYSAGKQDVTILSDNIDEMVSRVATVSDQVDSETTRIDNIINAQGDYVRQSQLPNMAGYAMRSDLPSLDAYVRQSELSGLTRDSRFDGLSSDVGSMNTDIKSLQATVTGYADRLAALESTRPPASSGGSSGGVSTPTGDLVIDLGYNLYGFTIVPDPLVGNTTAQASSLFFTVQNNSSQEVENIVIQLVLYQRETPTTFTTPTIGSQYPLQWTSVHAGSGVVVLRGSSPPWVGGLSIPAYGKVSVPLTFTMKTSSAIPASGIKLHIEAEVDSYDIVS